MWHTFCGSWGFPNSDSTLSWDLQMDMWRGNCLSKEHCKPNMSPFPPVTNSSNSRPDNETKCMCSFCMIPLGHCLPVFESHPDQSHSASSSRRIAQVLSKMRAPLVRLWRSNGRHLPGGMQWTCLRNPTWHRFISKQELSLHKLVLGLTPHIRNGILHTWSATRKSTTGATLARAWCRLGKGFFTQNWCHRKLSFKTIPFTSFYQVKVQDLWCLGLGCAGSIVARHLMAQNPSRPHGSLAAS